MATDPVCGMSVEPNQAAGPVTHQGRTYWFCSEDCRAKFQAEPQKYAGENSRRGLPTRWIVIGFLLVGGYFLFSEHRAHAIAVLPYLLLAACPLMHLFHGHGKHGDGDSHAGHRHDGGTR